MLPFLSWRGIFPDLVFFFLNLFLVFISIRSRNICVFLSYFSLCFSFASEFLLEKGLKPMKFVIETERIAKCAIYLY